MMKTHNIVTLIKLGLWEHAEFFSTDRNEYQEFHIHLDPIVKNQAMIHIKVDRGRAIFSYNFVTKEIGIVV